MPYAPGIEYHGDKYYYDSVSSAGKEFNQFLAGFLMPNTPTGAADAVPDPNAPDMKAFAAGEGPQRDPNATMAPKKPSLLHQLMGRLSAGAQSAAEGYDRYKQDSDESNALEKLLKTMYPDKKTQIDTLSLGEKRGMLQADQVQKATAQAQQLQQTRQSTARAALLRAMTAQQAAEDKAKKVPFTPKGGTSTITLANGKTIEVPWLTTSTGGAKSLDEMVPGNPKYDKTAKPTRDPGDGPRVSKDGKFYWDDAIQTWKPIAAGKGSGMGDLFPASGAGGGGAGPMDPKNDPLGLFSK